MRTWILLLVVLITGCGKRNPDPIVGFNYDLARTPPMGWNSWNCYGADINEKKIRDAARAMVESGMKDAGYQYIVIDDGWVAGRDRQGNLLADSVKFPNGMQPVIDYVHGLGLKFGIYLSAGTITCLNLEGSYGHEENDARMLGEWGVDYLKYDWCVKKGFEGKARVLYPRMAKALISTKKPIVFSIADGGMHKPWEWGKGIGHLWRTTYDNNKCWEEPEHHLGFTEILDQQVGLEAYAGPGHWNDPDMLQVGNGCLNHEENKAHFSLWCILAAPLFAGNNINEMPDIDREILTNKEAIAVNQDMLGIQGKKILDEGEFEIWSKPLSNGSTAVILFNREIKELEKQLDLSLFEGNNFKISDIWMEEELGVFTSNPTFIIPPHGVRFLILSPSSRIQ